MDWLRAIFKPDKKEEPPEAVQAEDLLDWFLERSESAMDSLRQDIRAKLDKLQEEIEAVNAALDMLATAKLQNESISEKAKAIMQGNRVAYIKFVRMFVSTLDLPEEATPERAQEFIMAFEEKLDSMHKSTAKSFYVLKEFFAHESGEVARHLKEIDAAMRSLRTDSFDGMLVVKKRIVEMDAIRKSRKDIAKGIVELGQEETVAENLIRETESQMRRLKQSPLWAELDRTLKEQQAIGQKLKQQETILHHKLSPLDRIMRKYAWLVPEHKEMVERYLETPVAALLADTSLDIIMIAQRMEQLVQDGQIELKDKEKEKAVQRLRELDRESLHEFLTQHHATKGSLGDLERRIRGNGVMRELEALEYKLTHVQEKRTRITESKEKLEKQHAKMDLEKMKEELQTEIRRALGVRVTIT